MCIYLSDYLPEDRQTRTTNVMMKHVNATIFCRNDVQQLRTLARAEVVPSKYSVPFRLPLSLTLVALKPKQFFKLASSKLYR